MHIFLIYTYVMSIKTYFFQQGSNRMVMFEIHKNYIDGRALTESGGEDSSSEEGSYDVKMPARYHSPKRSSLSYNREVQTPPPFKMDGKVSLKDYLSTFKSFFTTKFKGSSYAQTQKLAELISGDLLAVFNARGGRKLKYNDMKTQLLDYYKKQSRQQVPLEKAIK